MAKILLAEDDESLRNFLSRALEKVDHEVTCCEDGVQALDILRSGSFDLLLTDIVMPGLDGIELACRASEVNPEMKIVFITGFAGVALSSGAQALDGARVLSKPFHLRELVDEVERVIHAA